MSKAATTRESILENAFGLIYRQGYQATSVEDIIAATRVTKGAFFYHFGSKEDMGMAMIRDVMYPGMHAALIQPLQNSTNPITDLYRMMQHLLLKAPFFDVRYGCPAVNLIDEMAPINANFKYELQRLMQEWQLAMERSVAAGKKAGTVRADVHPRQVACFIAAGYGGVRNMGKMAGTSCYNTYLKELKQYLQSLT